MTTATRVSEDIEIKNGGPIEGILPVDISDGPGLYELQGSKGTGKSTVLNCLELLTGHKVEVTVHDGALDGHVKGFGRVVPLGPKKRGRGKLTVDSFDETFSVDDVIHPPLKTASARDRHRLKAILRLTESTLTSDKFSNVIGDELYAELGVEETEDAVEFCTRVKSALDARAREQERSAERERGKARGMRLHCQDVDATDVKDSDEVDDAVDEAVAKHAELVERQRLAEQAARDSEEASERLKKVKADYNGPTVSTATSVVEELAAKVDDQQEQVLKLTEQLKQAQEVLAATAVEHERASQALKEAKQHEAMVATLVDLAKQSVDFVRESVLVSAAAAVTEAKNERYRQVLIREALTQREQSKAVDEEADVLASQAEECRTLSKSLDEVLAKAFPSGQLYMSWVGNDLRLVYRGHKRQRDVLFDELSDGEKTVAVLELLLPSLQSPGLFPIPQRVYQDLPPSDIRQLIDYASSRGLFLVGARVTDGPLRIEKLTPGVPVGG